MKRSGYLFFLAALCSLNGCTQSSPQKKTADVSVGGRCEGCEAIHESPLPFDKLPAVVRLPDAEEDGMRILIRGTVFRPDGKTPAKDVVLYVYHTDQQGRYSQRGVEKGWGVRHGSIRGWVKTDEHGRYAIHTLRPAPYPGRQAPAHIHITVKEPGIQEYWIDEFLFADDPLLTREERDRQEQRGGSGIIRLQKAGEVWNAERNIILGKNIPGYPSDRAMTLTGQLYFFAWVSQPAMACNK